MGDRHVDLDLIEFYHRELSLFGVDSRSISAAASAKLLENLKPMFERGTLVRPVLALQKPMAEARALFDLVSAGSEGKAILLPSW